MAVGLFKSGKRSFAVRENIHCRSVENRRLLSVKKLDLSALRTPDLKKSVKLMIFNRKHRHDEMLKTYYFSLFTKDKSNGKLVENAVYSRISLMRLFISTSNAPEDDIFFSMVSIEDITVEWSRLNIFPMLGNDISVIFRIR